MTKALMVYSSATAIASLDEANLYGAVAALASTGTESSTQTSASEAMTFSKLGANIISGGSGTNNIRFRNATADGNQLASIAGTGVVEDATNTDAVAAGALFNLAFTDTGTNPLHSYVKANVEFTSGHGCVHAIGGGAGLIHDVASTTRFMAIGGSMFTDAGATEEPSQIKNRAYNSWAAMQVRVRTNARTNDSVFKNRINAADGTGVVTFGAAVTGLIEHTGINDAIADGDLLAASITLDTGVEDIIIPIVGHTLKSGSSKCECFIQGTIARAASSTAHYLPIGGALVSLTAFTEAQARVKVGFAGTASNLRCYLSANTYTVNATLKLYQNGSPVLTTTLTASGGAGWYENAVDTVTFAATDELSFELDEGTSGSATIALIAITLSDAAGGTKIPEFMHHYKTMSAA
jgi:hypothetical protein